MNRAPITSRTRAGGTPRTSRTRPYRGGTGSATEAASWRPPRKPGDAPSATGHQPGEPAWAEEAADGHADAAEQVRVELPFEDQQGKQRVHQRDGHGAGDGVEAREHVNGQVEDRVQRD